ncbi:malectin domain-containing carbohydrate-binding protein [Marinicellulosiphila megalodicopiae]|uniref:malectin domain-containing carbohydrate-binding protein n=1 Tax=Marinicellulosiphila megalodicopiae TaxID=2724896 RepID=UPI003BB0CF6A
MKSHLIIGLAASIALSACDTSNSNAANTQSTTSTNTQALSGTITDDTITDGTITDTQTNTSLATQSDTNTVTQTTTQSITETETEIITPTETLTQTNTITQTQVQTEFTVMADESNLFACFYDNIKEQGIHAGSSGSALNTPNALGAELTWMLNVEDISELNISVRYANGSNNSRDAQLSFAQLQSDLSFTPMLLPNTTDVWANWTEQSSQFSQVITPGEYALRLTATTAEGLPNIDYITITSNGKVSVVTTGLDCIEPVVYAINVGSTSPFASEQNIEYIADPSYLANDDGGAFYGTDTYTAEVDNTNDDALYQTQRFGLFTYELPVSNNVYTVTTSIAEMFQSAADIRKMGISIEGQSIQTNIDPFLLAGKNTALDITSDPVTVEDGFLTIQYTAEQDLAIVSAILVRSAYGQAEQSFVGVTDAGVDISKDLRFSTLALRELGTNQCMTAIFGIMNMSSVCGSDLAVLRLQVLSDDFLSIIDNNSGMCLEVAGDESSLQNCTNAPNQQFHYNGDAQNGYGFESFIGNKSLGELTGTNQASASFEVSIIGNADPMEVMVNERPIGWATIEKDIVISDGSPANGDEQTRYSGPTVGGGTWQDARAKNFSNVTWFKPSDFQGSTRSDSFDRLNTALQGSEAKIVIFEQGDYDFSADSPKVIASCYLQCGTTSGGTYLATGDFLAWCTGENTPTGTYNDHGRRIWFGLNKTIIGLGDGANIAKAQWVARNSNPSADGDFVSNVIFRNISVRDTPGDARVWNDGMYLVGADHIWLDHMSFSNFGRGSVVLSGTRVDDPNGEYGFYAYEDSGWMTFSWLDINSSEDWRCNGETDSPYPFFTTENPALTFDHTRFYKGHGRNPAIDGGHAHFINSLWEDVKTGLNGRHDAILRVEGSYLDGKEPFAMGDGDNLKIYAPWDNSLLTDSRKQNIFSDTGWPELLNAFSSRGYDVNTLNNDDSVVPSYPYGLDSNPSDVLDTVKQGMGIGQGGFINCTGDAVNYQCQ